MDPTQLLCPEAPDGGTHHLLPKADGSMVCRYCKKTRSELAGEAAGDVPALGVPR